jgi:AAA domain
MTGPARSEAKVTIPVGQAGGTSLVRRVGKRHRGAVELTARFVAAFKRGIEGELAALRGSAQLSEVALERGEDLGAQRYSFARTTTERLAPGTVCALRAAQGEQRVAIERVTDARVTLTASQPIDVSAPCALLVAPWFVYERLLQALDGITAAPLALTLFGKQPPRRIATELLRDHGALNASQRAAVQLCADSELAFVWGPPGTGKTATLVHIIEELRARDRRITDAAPEVDLRALRSRQPHGSTAPPPSAPPSLRTRPCAAVPGRSR